MTQEYGQPLMADLLGQTYTLDKTIAAIQALEGGGLFGPVVQLPQRSALTLLGPGFHDDLVKVRSGNSIFFVFRADLV